MSNTTTTLAPRKTDFTGVTPPKTLAKALKSAGVDVSTIRADAAVIDYMLKTPVKDRISAFAKNFKIVAETWVSKVQDNTQAHAAVETASTDTESLIKPTVQQPVEEKQTTAIASALGEEASNIVNFSTRIQPTKGPDIEEKGKWRSEIMEKGHQTPLERAENGKATPQKGHERTL